MAPLLSGITRRAICVQPPFGSRNPAIHNAHLSLSLFIFISVSLHLHLCLSSSFISVSLFIFISVSFHVALSLSLSSFGSLNIYALTQNTLKITVGLGVGVLLVSCWCGCVVGVCWLCRVVCVVWHAEKPSVCTFNTSPCVPATRPHVKKHVDVLPVHTVTF